MRIVLSILLSVLVSFTTPALAQIKTYDIKLIPSTNDQPSSYGELYQISPTRTFAMSTNWNGYLLVVALNSEGQVERTWESTIRGNGSDFYKYDPQSNTLVYLTTEFLELPMGESKARLRLILLDSNLTEKSNVVLDSTITGLPTEYAYREIGFSSITLLDSSILCMSSSFLTIKGMEQMILRFSKDGRFISRTSIKDTIQPTSYYPWCQLPTGGILFSRLSNPTGMGFTRKLIIADTFLHFAAEPVIDSTNFYFGAATVIPTSDSGFALAYYYKYLTELKQDVAVLAKYDKKLQKQWEAYVPGLNSNRIIKIIESRQGGYYITTGGYDTAEISEHPEYLYSTQCLQDIVLSRVNASGRVLFTAFYGSEICLERPYSMIQDLDGGIVIAGSYGVPARHEPCEAYCEGPASGWLFKVDSLGGPAKHIVGVEEKREVPTNIRLYPSPASGMLTVELGRAGYFTSIEVLDLSGRVLYTSAIEDIKQLLVGVDISAFTSGSYYCRLRANSYFIVRPFVIQK